MAFDGMISSNPHFPFTRMGDGEPFKVTVVSNSDEFSQQILMAQVLPPAMKMPWRNRADGT